MSDAKQYARKLLVVSLSDKGGEEKKKEEDTVKIDLVGFSLFCPPPPPPPFPIPPTDGESVRQSGEEKKEKTENRSGRFTFISPPTCVESVRQRGKEEEGRN